MRSILLFVAVGCQVEAVDSPSTKTLVDFSAAVQAAQERMHVRYTAARQIEIELARSDLDQAKVYAHTISELDEPDALPTWQPYTIAIRNAARQIEITNDIVTAARMTGMLGMRCAQCHVAIKAHVTFPDRPRPSEDPKLASQMLGHQWAAVEMWEGLIGPSDERWLVGARALTTVPINIVAQAKTPAFAGDIDDVSRVRLYARRALAATTDDARAEVFGTMLATCAHCHALLRDR
jgi:hypothetical protein